MVIVSLGFFVLWMANNPFSYAAIMTLACSTSRCLWSCEC